MPGQHPGAPASAAMCQVSVMVPLRALQCARSASWCPCECCGVPGQRYGAPEGAAVCQVSSGQRDVHTWRCACPRHSCALAPHSRTHAVSLTHWRTHSLPHSVTQLISRSHTERHTRTNARVHTCTHAHARSQANTQACALSLTHTHTHTHIYIYIYTCTPKHTCTLTQTCVPLPPGSLSCSRRCSTLASPPAWALRPWERSTAA